MSQGNQVQGLGSGYIGIGYVGFLAIMSIFASYFWSQKEVYIIDYFGDIVISDLSSIFAWSQWGWYNRNPVYNLFSHWQFHLICNLPSCMPRITSPYHLEHLPFLKEEQHYQCIYYKPVLSDWPTAPRSGRAVIKERKGTVKSLNKTYDTWEVV